MDDDPTPIRLTSGKYGKMDAEVLSSNLTLASKAVWAALRQFENGKTGQCNPSREALSKATNLSVFSITKGITELKNRGLLSRQKQGNRSSIYVLQQPPKTANPEGKKVDFEGASKLTSEASRGKESCPLEGKKVDFDTTYTIEQTIEQTTTTAAASEKNLKNNNGHSPPQPPPEDAEEDWGWGAVSPSYRTAIVSLWDQIYPSHEAEDQPLQFFMQLHDRYGEPRVLETLQKFSIQVGTVHALKTPTLQSLKSYLLKMAAGEPNPLTSSPVQQKTIRDRNAEWLEKKAERILNAVLKKGSSDAQ